ADRRRVLEADVRRTFAAVVASARLRTLAAEGMAVAERLADASRHRARAGDVGGADVQLAEIETVRAAQVAAAMEAAEADDLARLAALVGAPAEEPLVVAPD